MSKSFTVAGIPSEWAPEVKCNVDTIWCRVHVLDTLPNNHYVRVTDDEFNPRSLVDTEWLIPHEDVQADV